MIMDSMTIGEEIVNRKTGEVLYKDCGVNVPGEVEVIYRSKRNGKAIITREVFPNTLLVTGAVYGAERFNNERSTFQTTPIDVLYGVHTSGEVVVDNTTIGLEKICGIMVGNGGAIDTSNTVHKVDRTKLTVPSPIPFRVVDVNNDLSSSARSSYLLRVVKDGYAYYYGKVFDIARTIKVEYEDGTLVPTDVNTTGSTKYIKVYTEYVVTLDKYDIREYFKLTQGSTQQSLINSIGLIAGYAGQSTDNHTEYYNVRGITAANTSNREFRDTESTLTFVYRQFIQ